MQLHEENPDETKSGHDGSDQENKAVTPWPEEQPHDTCTPPDPANTNTSGEETPQIPDKDLCYEDIRHLVIELAQHFEAKLKYDKHKELIIDRLHKENQAFKEDLYKKLLKPLLMEIIMLYDDYSRLSHQYAAMPSEDETCKKMLHHFGMIHQDLEDILYKYGVEAFEVAGETLDASRQKVIQTVPAADASLDKTLCQRLKKGFEWEGTLLRPEHISCYVYKPTENL